MDAADWAKLKDWFGDALDAPERIDDILLEAERASPALATQLRSLLREHHAQRFETKPLTPPRGIGVEAHTSDLAGEQIGPYRVLRELGRGGTGLVMLAERADDEFHRLVALKVLRYISWDRRSRDLLTLERRALSQLQHPNIAALLDWGETPDGDPWLATEFVDGEPIDQYCRARELDVEETLAVFAQVCEAVQYAHRRLVVHRDLKPENILVTSDGRVQLLDFGISKPLEDLTVTSAVERRFTPAYASPEQIKGEPVTAATDVYALGLVCYELLTGSLPHDADSIEGIVRRLEDKPVLPPSSTPGLARGRQKAIRGDLDRIVLHALERDPQHRYPSVEQLLADLESYRAGFPIAIQRPSAAYRLQKFVSRHAIVVALGSLAFVALLGGATLAIWNARVARQEQRVAEKRFRDLQDFAHSVIYDLHDAIRGVPGTVAARRELVVMAVKYLDGLNAENIRDDSLQFELAGAYARMAYIQGGLMGVNLGDTPASMRSYHAALRILNDLWPRHPDRDDIGALRFGAVYHLSLMMNDPAAAFAFVKPFSDEADQWVQRRPQGPALQASDLLHAALGRMQRARGALDAALQQFDLSVQRQQQLMPLTERKTAAGPMFGTYVNAGQNLFQRTLTLFARAETLLEMGRARDAHAAIEAASLALTDSTTIRDSPSNQRMLARVHGLTAMTLLALGRVDQAVSASQAEMRVAETNLADGSATAQRDWAEAHRHAGKIALAQDHAPQAASSFQRAIEIMTKTTERDPTFVHNHLLLAGMLNDAGDFQRALRIADSALKDAPSSADLLRERARANAGLARTADAIPDSKN